MSSLYSVNSVSNQSSSSISSISLLSERVDGLHFDIERYVPKIETPLLRGSKKKRFMPIARRGLYIKMINNCNNMQEIARSCVESIDNDLNRVHELLQIIPDLLLIDSNVEQYSSQEYDMQIGSALEIAAKRLVHVLECDTIFTHDSTYARNLSKMIDTFLWFLCKQLTSSVQIIPTFEKIMRIFISFLRHVGKSEVNALRLTAYMFAFRIQKYLCLRKIQLACSDALVDLDRTALIYDAINNVIRTNKLDAINGGRQHNAIFQAFYLEFAQNNYICIMADDEHQFANEKNITFLAELLKLKKTSIVKNSIESCTTLVRQSHLMHVFEMRGFREIIEGMYCRLNHTNDEIAMLAAIFFATAFQYGHNIEDHFEKVMHRMIIRAYSQNLKLARMFAQTVAVYLKNYDCIVIYKFFLKAARLFNANTYERATRVKYSYLVEALYHYLEPVRPSCILKALIKPTPFIDAEYKAMLEVFYNSCCVFYNGKISKDRNQNEVKDVEDCDRFSMTRDLFYAFSKLMTASKADGDAMVWIFKSLSLIDYASPDLYQLKKDLTSIVKDSLKLLDDVQINEDLWFNITQFVQKASFINGGNSYLIMTEVELAKAVDYYTQYISDLQNAIINAPEDELRELRLRIIREATKIRAIFFCDVSVATLDLECFYSYWVDSDLPSEIIMEQISMCALYFKCKVREILKCYDSLYIDETFVRRLKVDARSFWVSMDLLLANNMEFYHTILEAMGIFIRNYMLLFTPRTSIDIPCMWKAALHYWEHWSTCDIIFETFFEECVRTSNDQAIPINLRYFDIIFSLYYLPDQPNALTPYIVKLVAYYGQCYKLHKTSYKHFFDEVIQYESKDFFYIVVSALKFVEDDEDVNVDAEQLCKLLATFLLNAEMVKFLKYFIEFVKENETYSILKYLAVFAIDLPKKEKLDVKEYARDILTDEHNITL